MTHTEIAHCRFEASANSALVPPNLLVIDDDQLSRILISKAARRAGHRVVEANSMTEALDRMRTVTFDCVTLDLMLEDSDGLDVLRSMSMLGYCGSVIVISGADASFRHVSRELARSLGMELLQSFHKPIDYAALRVSLENIRRKRAGLPIVRE